MLVTPGCGIGFQLLGGVAIQLLQRNDVGLLILHPLEVSSFPIRDFGEAIPDIVRDDAEFVFRLRVAREQETSKD